MNNLQWFKRAALLLPLLLTGCIGKPSGIDPVQNFDGERYLGVWYEIARLDHSFERGMDNVSAEYTARDDGGIAVINRGYKRDKNEWKEAIGKAYFVENDKTGYLKVSFFGPFYGSYIIFELDEPDYQYAFVSGANTSYLWLLSREPSVSDELKQEFVETITKRGFDPDNLIWVSHDR